MDRHPGHRARALLCTRFKEVASSAERAYRDGRKPSQHPPSRPAGHEDPAARLDRSTPPAAHPLGHAGGDPSAGLHHRFCRRQPLPGPSPQFHYRPRPATASGRPARLCPAHGAADADRHGRVAGLYLHLCHLGGEKCSRRNPAGAAAGHFAVGANPILPVGHHRLVPVAVAGAGVRGRTGLRLHHLHRTRRRLLQRKLAREVSHQRSARSALP